MFHKSGQFARFAAAAFFLFGSASPVAAQTPLLSTAANGIETAPGGFDGLATAQQSTRPPAERPGNPNQWADWKMPAATPPSGASSTPLAARSGTNLGFAPMISLPHLPIKPANAALPPVPTVVPAAPATRLDAGPKALTTAERQGALRALALIDAGQYDKADGLIRAQSGNRVLKAYLDWEMYRRAGTGSNFAEIAAFIDAHPDWPRLDLLQRRAEEAINDTTDHAKLTTWFAAHPPLTGPAMARYGELLVESGRKPEGAQWLRKAWIEGSFSAKEEADFVAEHGDMLNPATNYARADRLLFDDPLPAEAVRRMLPRLDAGHRSVAEARLALRLNAGGAEKMVQAVPKALIADPGLSYERMRYRQRQGRNDDTDIPLGAAPSLPLHAEKVWNLRHAKARAALAEGRISDAYKYISNLGNLPPQQLADAEFLAGWIALRLLDQPREAIKHFDNLERTVRFPVSKARAAYWIGRTYEAAKDPVHARDWYEKAAEQPATYYGQLALLKLDRRGVLELPRQAQLTPSAKQAFDKRELYQAAMIVDDLGQADRLRQFVLRLQETSATLEEKALTMKWATEIGRPDLALAAAKRAFQGGHLVAGAAFPIVAPLDKDFGLDAAIVLAVSRQESEFNPSVVSPAGAIGLMQLMPATAKEQAKKAGLTYSVDKLTDPTFNARLGSRYMSQLLANWDGNLVLAVASYNAGEARARKWIKDWGDPRQPKVDVVDWVELIPFTETRNYVQRVIEGVQVYRQLTAERGGKPTAVALGLDADLRGREKWKICSTC